MRLIFLISLSILPATANAQAQPLNLTCGGGGSAVKERESSIYAQGSNGNSAWGQGSQTVDVGFQDQVDVRLFSGDDRIRLPRTMLPPIRGGDGGWFKLKNVATTDREITGSAAVNVINSPKVHIDRLTGVISINGKAGTYTGQCQKVMANAKPQF